MTQAERIRAIMKKDALERQNLSLLEDYNRVRGQCRAIIKENDDLREKNADLRQEIKDLGDASWENSF